MPLVPQGITYLEKRQTGTNESKFWACRFEPTTSSVPALHLWWGRIYTKGQDKVIGTYTTDLQALNDAQRRAELKLREGYVPVTMLDWSPEFLKLVGREPQTPSLARGAGRDGWDVLNGREVRPPSWRERRLEAKPVSVERNVALDVGIDRASGPDYTVKTTVSIVTGRVIDFED